MSADTLPVYNLRAANPLPPMDAGWNSAAWAQAEIAIVKHFLAKSSSHRPRVEARLAHDGASIRGIFRVDDQYVRSVRTEYLDSVWLDSCVEFFMRPRPDRGYFNLEMNAGGAHLCYFVEDWKRIPGGFEKFTKLPTEIGTKIQIRSSLPKVIAPELTEPVSWELNFFIPVAVLENYLGKLGPLSGQSWRGNFYKCAVETSHPHWAAWSPVDEFNFHLPHCFGRIQFE